MSDRIVEILHTFITKRIAHNTSAQLFCFSGLSFDVAIKLEHYVNSGHPLMHNGQEIGFFVLDSEHVEVNNPRCIDEAGTVALRNDANHHFILLLPFGSSCSMSVDTTVESIGIEDESYSSIADFVSTDLYKEIVGALAPSSTEDGKYIQSLIERSVRELLESDSLFVSAVWDFLSGLLDVANRESVGVSTAEAYCGVPCSAGYSIKEAARYQKDFFKHFTEVIADSASHDEFFAALQEMAEEGKSTFDEQDVSEFERFVDSEMPRIDKTPYLAFGDYYRQNHSFRSWWTNITLSDMVKVIRGNEEKSAILVEAESPLCGFANNKSQPLVFDGAIAFKIQSQTNIEDVLQVRKTKRTAPPTSEYHMLPNEEIDYVLDLEDDDKKKKGGCVKLFFGSKQTKKIISCDVIALPFLKSGMHMTIKDHANLHRIKIFKIKNKNSSKTFREEITVKSPGDVTCQLFVNDKSRVLLKPVEYVDAQGESQYFNFQADQTSAVSQYSVRLNVYNELTFKFKGFSDGVEYTYEVVFYVKEAKVNADTSESFYDEHVRRNLLRKQGPVSHGDRFEVSIPAGKDILNIERILISEAASGCGGYPIIIADDYKRVLLSGNKQDFSLPVQYTTTPYGAGVDVRPDFEKWKASYNSYGQDYQIAKQKFFSVFETEYAEKCIEEIDLAQVSEDFAVALKNYANAYCEWLHNDYVNASVAETIWVFSTRENHSLSEAPSQVIIPPTHPLRLAWQVWAQGLMFDAESRFPSNAVSIFDTDAVPDMLYLPLRNIGGRDGAVRNVPMFSVKSSSRYWGVLYSYENASGLLNDNYLWSSEFGLSFEKTSKIITKEQVESALNDAREMCMAKPSLSISFNGESGKGICREGILSWNQQFIDEDNSQVNQLGPRRLKIYDVGGRHLPSNEVIAAMSDQSEGAIQWFAPDKLSEQMDLSIATLAAHDCKIRESNLGNSVTAVGGLACYRSRQLCNGSYVIESRRTTPVNDWRAESGSFQDIISKILQNLSNPFKMDVSGLNTHIGFPTDVRSLVANEKASYYAISSADVDHACFVAGGGSEAYLWDYRLPQGNAGARNTEGFYLLARETPVMFKAVAKAVSSISGSSSGISDKVIQNTLHLTAQRGIPTIKDLTLGGTKALGEVGILVAVSVLQDDITNSINKGLFPPYVEDGDKAWLNFVVPFDPFRRQFESLIIDDARKVRPDLACISVCCRKDNESLSPLRIKFSFIEVKTRTNQFSDTDKQKALEQYSTCYKILSSTLQDRKTSLHSLAVYDFLVGLFTFGFRVYGTFPGVENLNLDAFYGDVVRNIFEEERFVELEQSPRLLVVDSASTMAMDAKNGVYCTIRINGSDACKALARQENIPLPKVQKNWRLMAEPLEQQVIVDTHSDQNMQGSEPAVTIDSNESLNVPDDNHVGSKTQDVNGEAIKPVAGDANEPDIDVELQKEIDEAKEALLRALSETRISGTLVEQPKIAPNSIVFTFDGQAASMDHNIIKNRAIDFKVHYGVEILRVVAKRLRVSVHVKRQHREFINWGPVWSRVISECKQDKKLLVGIAEEDGRCLFLDPVSKHGPHTLIAGATGSGKSVLLRNLLIGIGSIYTPQESRIVLIDPKCGQDYFAFEGMPHFYGGGEGNIWISNQDQAKEMLKSLVLEMERRVKIMSQARCKDLTEYQKKIGDPNSKEWIPRLWVFHDEFAMWMLDKDYKKVIDSTISQLAVMARSAGIHLIFATQRPSADVVSVQTRNNLNNRLILKVSDEGTSQVALGRPGAESLLGRGHILIKREGAESDDAIEGQVPYNEESNAESAVKDIARDYSMMKLDEPLVIYR